ncbi:hypothetical protein QW060_14610 [Myroides ceti]|uniref:Nucleoside 2-deoxyribosyltransferase n=1 Tax=Paenimyroides ceti TaxID=395087 RepID=A0ABT8CV03_9FLAO|nr:hypothetical protein [Paenimyroides ceti]MDN3708333.1 hypothetical protein [Paenimyroides ceti]
MKAYISIDYTGRKKLNKEIIALGMALGSANVEQHIFVDKNPLEEGQESELMHKALQEIDTCNFLILECSHLNVTSCIEAGYAKAKRKPIVYLQNESATISPVLSGISNFHIFYNSPKDLFDQMSEFLKNILPQK